jgi:hypothetical protein
MREKYTLPEGRHAEVTALVTSQFNSNLSGAGNEVGFSEISDMKPPGKTRFSLEALSFSCLY